MGQLPNGLLPGALHIVCAVLYRLPPLSPHTLALSHRVLSLYPLPPLNIPDPGFLPSPSIYLYAHSMSLPFYHPMSSFLLFRVHHGHSITPPSQSTPFPLHPPIRSLSPPQVHNGHPITPSSHSIPFPLYHSHPPPPRFTMATIEDTTTGAKFRIMKGAPQVTNHQCCVCVCGGGEGGLGREGVPGLVGGVLCECRDYERGTPGHLLLMCWQNVSNNIRAPPK